MKANLFRACLIAMALSAVSLSACDDDDNNNGEDTTSDAPFKYVFAATTNEQTVILSADDLTKDTLISLVGNGVTVDKAGTFWIDFQNKFFYSMVYNQGSDGTNQSWFVNQAGQVEERSWKLSGHRFTSLGIVGDEMVTVASADAADDSKADAAGHLPKILDFTYIDPNNQKQYFPTDGSAYSFDNFLSEDFLGNGEYVELCGLQERDGKFVTGVIPIGMSPYGTTVNADKVILEDLVTKASTGTGSGRTTPGQLSGSQYPDEAYVAFFDDVHTLSGKKIAKTTKIAYPAGRYRSQYHQMTWVADNGDIYVFSPSYSKTATDSRQQTTLPAGVVRIPSGSYDFDDYYCNLEELTGAKGFLRAWYLTDDKFLLRVYEEPYGDGFTGTALTLAIFDASDKSLKTVSGLPQKSTISDLCHGVNKPLVVDGKAIVDVSTSEGNPAFYAIDIASAAATKGATVNATSIYCAGKLFLLEDEDGQ